MANALIVVASVTVAALFATIETMDALTLRSPRSPRSPLRASRLSRWPPRMLRPSWSPWPSGLAPNPSTLRQSPMTACPKQMPGPIAQPRSQTAPQPITQSRTQFASRPIASSAPVRLLDASEPDRSSSMPFSKRTSLLDVIGRTIVFPPHLYNLETLARTTRLVRLSLPRAFVSSKEAPERLHFPRHTPKAQSKGLPRVRTRGSQSLRRAYSVGSTSDSW